MSRTLGARLTKIPEWLRVVISASIFTIFVLVAALYADMSLFDYSPKGNSSESSMAIRGTKTFRRWDVNHYLTRIDHEYANTPPHESAFFPIYPITARLISHFTHLDPNLVLIFFSILCCIAFAVVIFYWAKFELTARKSKVSPWLVLALVALFPTSFYMAIGYTESLFMLLTVGALFAYRREKYILAAILSGLSAATRTQGAIIALFFFLDYILARDWKKWRKLLPAIGAGIGVGLYMLFLLKTFGNPLQFVAAQQDWGRLSGNPIANLLQSFTPPYLWYIPVLVFGLYSIRKYLGKTWFWYSLVFILLPIISGRLDSLNRYILACPPFFIALALSAPKTPTLWRNIYLITCGFLLAWNILLFFNGYWVG